VIRSINTVRAAQLPLDATSLSSVQADAVRIVKSGWSFKKVSNEFDVTETALRQWFRRTDANAGKRTDVLMTKERQELVHLRRENRELRQKREILKAAATFFAKESA
jgi:transposase